MKTVQLGSLRITNFKGIKFFDIEFNDAETSIYGDNATGKTTIFDAVTWLLFDKDSLNSAKFDILPVGSEGLEAEVEAAILIDRAVTVFKKVYSEKWTRKRGSAQPELTGHNIDHFINGVPVKKNEYASAITEICDEETFRLLTIPRYFNEVMHWQKRRVKLFEVCGDMTDEQVIASNSELSKLPEILGDRTMDDYKKIVIARRVEIDHQIEKIPVQINEAEQAKADVPDDPTTLNKEIETMMSRKKTFESEILRLKEGGQTAELQKQFAELDSKIIRLRNQDAIAYQKIQAKVNQQNDIIARRIFELKADKNFVASNLILFQRNQADLESRIGAARQQWNELNAQEFTGDTNCPTCGQSLPEDQVQATRERFNLNQSQQLAKIKIDGNILKRQLAELPHPAEFAGQTELEKLESTPPEELPKPTVSPEILTLEKIKFKLNEEIATIQAGTENAAKIAELRTSIAGIESQISVCRSKLAQIETNQRQVNRIAELKASETALAKEFEKIEGELNLCELFIRTKVEMVSEAINSKFQLVKFQLFRELINGSIEEVCNTTVNNVPYGSMNNGARINAGLDIINVMSEHYGIKLFQFIDNAEAVTVLLPTASQQIRLVVNEADKTLRKE